MSIYTFSQNRFVVSAESPVFPPKEVFIDISNLSAEDNYELVKDWISVNFNSDDNLVIDQECNNFITLASTVDDLYMDQSHLFTAIRAKFAQLMSGYMLPDMALEEFIVAPGLTGFSGEVGALALAMNAE